MATMQRGAINRVLSFVLTGQFTGQAQKCNPGRLGAPAVSRPFRGQTEVRIHQKARYSRQEVVT